MKNLQIPRIDIDDNLHNSLLRHCRLSKGEVWDDPKGIHRIGCLDATDIDDVKKLMVGNKAVLAIQDPPYNLIAFQQRSITDFTDWCNKWILNTYDALLANSSLYIWLGADQNNNFQPLPDFILMMRQTPFKSRSFITMRNQRGYGTQQNWMAIRQELLYYTKTIKFLEEYYIFYIHPEKQCT